jgi:predicted nucleic acid-binding protein
LPGFVPDTSVIVAAVCAWHENHTAAAGEIEKRLTAGQKMVVAAHALLEAYAVLTRLPPPHRLAPGNAHAVLRANFVVSRRIVSLDAADTTALLRTLAREGIGGGQTYDAIIATCARRAKASALLTFNAAHFEPFGGAALAIAVPGLRS